MDIFNDQYFMNQAYNQAVEAYNKGEIPVGAVVVANNKIIARAHNLTEALNDVTAHAEMQAITSATNRLGGKYLNECTLYVTLEPCVMCAGALAWSQLGKLVYAACDQKRGYTQLAPNVLHPKTQISSGIMASECGELIKAFFKERR